MPRIFGTSFYFGGYNRFSVGFGLGHHSYYSYAYPYGYWSYGYPHYQYGYDAIYRYGPTGTLRLKVRPRHAEVFVDGYFVGRVDDFDGVFRKAATDVKRAEVDRNAAHFGADWIVFPNATYGDWSTAPLTAWDAPLKTQ